MRAQVNRPKNFSKIYVYGLVSFFGVLKFIGAQPPGISVLTILQDGGNLIRRSTYPARRPIYNLILSSSFVTTYLYILASSTIFKMQVAYFNPDVVGIFFASFVNSLCLGIILSFWFYQRAIMNMYNRLVECEIELKKLSDDIFNLQQGQCFCFLIIVTHLILSIVRILIMFVIIPSRHAFLLRLLLVIRSYYLDAIMLQYAFTLNFIKTRFYFINESLLSLSSYANNNQNFSMQNIPTKYECLRCLRTVERVYRTLYEVAKDFSQFFSIPLFFIISIGCLGLTSSCYLFTMALVRGKIWLSDVVELSWIITAGIVLITMTSSVNNIIEEMKRTSFMLYDLVDEFSTSTQIKYEIEQLTVKLLHRKITFSAYGIFELDRSLLLTISSTMVTYMTIMQQFKTAKNTLDGFAANATTSA